MIPRQSWCDQGGKCTWCCEISDSLGQLAGTRVCVQGAASPAGKNLELGTNTSASLGKQNKQQQSDCQGILPPGAHLASCSLRGEFLGEIGDAHGAGIAAVWKGMSSAVGCPAECPQDRAGAAAPLVHSRAFASLEGLGLEVGTGAGPGMLQP